MTKKLTMRLIPALMMFGFAGVASASGFALQNQTGSGNGNAFAGAAAAAEDASTLYWNPAGMTYLPQGHSIALSGTLLKRSIDFKDHGSTDSPGFRFGTNNSNGGDAGGLALIPSGQWAYSIAPDVWVGIGVSPTFGNVTEYKKNFIGRSAGYFADIEQININPSLAIKVNDFLSLGLGVNFSHTSVAFNQGIPTSATNYLGVAGSGWGMGGNIGAMFQLSPSTRVGVAYRTSIGFGDIDGKQKLHPALGPVGATTFVNQDVKARGYETPGNLSLAVSQKLSDRWELLGDLTWTDWSVWKKLTLTQKEANGAIPAGTAITSLSYNFVDTFRVGLGANYKYSDALKLRFGVAFDQSPIKSNADRTMTLPDSDRTWLSFGGKYTFSKAASLDVGYSHIFFKDTSTARAVDFLGTRQTIRGNWNNSADSLSVQYNHTF